LINIQLVPGTGATFFTSPFVFCTDLPYHKAHTMKPLSNNNQSTASSMTVTDHESIQALLAEAEAAKKKAHPPQPKSTPKRYQSAVGTSATSTIATSSRHSDSSSVGNKRPRNDYYGPVEKYGNNDNGDETKVLTEKKKPDFGLSGALLGSTTSGSGGCGTIYKGVELKFQEPPEARTPNTQWRLYVFKDDKQIDTLHIAKQSAYLIGRNEDIADIFVSHPSISSQHAVIQYRAVPNKDTGKLSCQPYLLDLESTNGSFINGVQIESARYYQLKKGDVIKFGSSTREYVLLAA
jgi:smad nuclear-interacting protein 1